MINFESISKSFLFESEKIERLDLFRKLALVFTIIKELSTFCIYIVFTSLFLSFFKIADFDSNIFAYIVLGFINLVLIIILYANLSKQIPTTIQQIFPSNTLTENAFRSYSITTVLIVMYAAWTYTNWLFSDTDFNKNAFDFFLGWIANFGVIFGIVLLQTVINKPIKSFKNAYFQQISNWLIKQIDKNVSKNEAFKWNKSNSNQENPNQKGIQLSDMEAFYPDKIDNFYLLEVNQSLTFFAQQEKSFECAQVNLKSKEVKSSSGKTETSINVLLKGTILKKHFPNNNHSLVMETTSFFTQTDSEKTKSKTMEFDNQKIVFTGDTENINMHTFGTFVAKIKDDWKAEIRLVLDNDIMYLSINGTNIFQDYALSATLYDNSHIRKPLEIIQGFYQLEA